MKFKTRGLDDAKLESILRDIKKLRRPRRTPDDE
jgi:hypothetical protein